LKLAHPQLWHLPHSQEGGALGCLTAVLSLEACGDAVSGMRGAQCKTALHVQCRLMGRIHTLHGCKRSAPSTPGQHAAHIHHYLWHVYHHCCRCRLWMVVPMLLGGRQLLAITWACRWPLPAAVLWVKGGAQLLAQTLMLKEGIAATTLTSLRAQVMCGRNWTGACLTYYCMAGCCGAPCIPGVSEHFSQALDWPGLDARPAFCMLERHPVTCIRAARACC
jgi:hypothetical protein